MKKIGFVDYYLWNFHANTYPEMIKKYSDGEMEVAYCYGTAANPLNPEQTSEAWAETNGVEMLSSIEEVVEKSDYIIVLSPNNPEQHRALCEIPLKSGKPVYIDKTFAPDAETAKEIFAIADAHGTPCYSSSALFFADELKDLQKENVEYMTSFGSGGYETHSIHQIEQVVTFMGRDAESVMYTGTEKFPSFKVRFAGDRYADIIMMPGRFRMHVGYGDGKAVDYTVDSPIFDRLVENMVKFFRTTEIPVPHAQTVEVIAIREASIRAKETPFVWVDIQK
ncbi:MAG: hypothetical protein E7408_05520 [Ruminococcaceae bacterium]|nr:hypothetical protein [Oscillospiraceae bacterium]